MSIWFLDLASNIISTRPCTMSVPPVWRIMPLLKYSISMSRCREGPAVRIEITRSAQNLQKPSSIPQMCLRFPVWWLIQLFLCSRWWFVTTETRLEKLGIADCSERCHSRGSVLLVLLKSFYIILHNAPTDPKTFLSVAPFGKPCPVGGILALNSRQASTVTEHSSETCTDWPALTEDCMLWDTKEKAAVNTEWTRFKQ